MILRKIDYIFLKSIFFNIFMIAAFFFPFIFLSDVILGESFDLVKSVLVLPSKYRKVLHVFCLWGVFLGVQSIKMQYKDLTFISIAFRKIDALRFLIVLMTFFVSISLFVCVPLNIRVFPEIIASTKWKMDLKKDNVTFFHNSCHGQEIWQANNNKLTYKKSANVYENNDYYIVWNTSENLSFAGLKRAKKYLIKNKLNHDHIKKQWHIFMAQGLLIISLILCGFVFAWKKDIRELILCTIIAHWIAQLAGFLPLYYAIFFLWFNVLFWLIVGIWYLFL